MSLCQLEACRKSARSWPHSTVSHVEMMSDSVDPPLPLPMDKLDAETKKQHEEVRRWKVHMR